MPSPRDCEAGAEGMGDVSQKSRYEYARSRPSDNFEFLNEEINLVHIKVEVYWRWKA